MRLKVMIMVGALLALTACAGGKLSEAERMEPNSTDFYNALATGYLELARDEYAEADYADADYFAERAILAGSGTGDVQPPEATARKLPQSDAFYVLTAREELVAVLDGGARSGQPQKAAEAQVTYECWIQELEENIQPDHIAACRDRLDVLIGELRPAPQQAAAPAPAPAPAKSKPPKGKLFRVYFVTNSATLSAEAKEAIRQAVALAQNFDPPRVVVSGYTDSVGSPKANETLSLKRARKVAANLVLSGVPEKGISIKGYGERFQDMRTADGVAEVKNRRVEIQVAP